MDALQECQAEIRRLRSVVRELQDKETEQEYVFALGFSLLQNFLSEKPCEDDAAYAFCKIIYSRFKTSECYKALINKTDNSECAMLKCYIESLFDEELDELYWEDWSTL